MGSVPKKFRVPQNTDTELNTEERKRKLKENRVLKLNKQNASIKNSSHLVDLLMSKKVESERGDENADSDSISDSDHEGNRQFSDFVLFNELSVKIFQNKNTISTTMTNFNF